MLKISNPVQLFAKQKVVNTNSNVENQSLTGVEVKRGRAIVIAYRFEAGEFLAGEERTQLLKILGACKLTEEDVVLINTAQAKSFSVAWLRNKFPVHTLLVFGEIEISKNFQLKKYFAYNIDGLQILKGETLTRLLKSDADKKSWWTELKKVFRIK